MDAPMPSKLQLLAVPLVLAVLLFAVSAAHATPVSPTITPLSFEEEFAVDEEEGEESSGEPDEGTCEAAEEEFEEGELSGAEVKEICDEEAEEHRKKATGPGPPAPEECILRSAHGEATTSGQGDKLKLTIGYTTYEPVAAMLKVGHLDAVHRHLGRSGVLRLVERLHGHDSPKQVSVRIDIASTKSAGCPFRRLVLSPR
jgi:hypothetical protein